VSLLYNSTTLVTQMVVLIGACLLACVSAHQCERARRARRIDRLARIDSWASRSNRQREHDVVRVERSSMPRSDVGGSSSG